MITRRTWRSETYTAITNRPEFQREIKNPTEFLSSSLAEILGLFIPHSKYKLRPSIRTVIIEPALALAHKMNLSVDEFSIKWTIFSNSPQGQQPTKSYPFREQFQYFEMVNLMAAGKPIKNPPGAGHLDYVIDIMPRLVMRTAKADVFGDEKVLKRPKLLVAVPTEGQPRLTPPRVKPGDEVTLLGLLHRILREGRRTW